MISGAFSTFKGCSQSADAHPSFSCKLTREVKINFLLEKSVAGCTSGHSLESVSPREETVSFFTLDFLKRASTIISPQESHYFSYSNFPLKTGLC